MYYFLDVDGVLNKASDWSQSFVINQQCFKNFIALLDCDPDPHIILSSTWRNGYNNKGERSVRANSLYQQLEAYHYKIEWKLGRKNK